MLSLRLEQWWAIYGALVAGALAWGALAALASVLGAPAGLAAAGDRAGTNVVPTLAVLAVDAAGTAVFAAVDAVGLANGVAAANDPDVLSVAIGCATLSIEVAGGALAFEAGGPAELAAATAAATAALALAIAAIASFETGLALAAEVVASGTFFLQADMEPSAITAHDASKKRNPICKSPAFHLG